MTKGPQAGSGPVAATSTTTAATTGATPTMTAPVPPPTSTPGTSADIPLQSLAPKYEEEHHGTYLRRLEAAVKDPRNLNIALTGRYGAGKSSVLDEFQSNHHRSVQRLAISSLTPGGEDGTTTNEIQKEIVKHLLYGASQKVGKNSRFNRIAVLTWPGAIARSAPVVVCVGVLLYLLGRMPDVRYTGSGEPTWIRVGVWAGVAAAVSVGLALALRATHGRFRVSDVSAGGAALTLSENPETFFDKFTDEIVHYFDRESKDIVVFEDLDRFEDPRIFEALRELNVLLNSTPKRRAKRRGNLPGRALRWLLGLLPGDAPATITEMLPFPWATRLLGLGVPLRFVYAVKDSVFEKIDTATATATAKAVCTGPASGAESAGTGTDGTAGKKGASQDLVDAAAAETQRANRTKFFDIVIPLVPFISHRNARELLIDVLNEAGIGDVDRRLVNVVARYCTDMRLLRNMCNEYLLFAERLLEGDKVAPDLSSSKIFALVAYKNFHLSDFENISRGESDLDRLYELHQQMVRESIASREQSKREQRAAPTRERERDELAAHLGGRLGRYGDLVLRVFSIRNTGYRHTCFKVGAVTFPQAELTGREFWKAVAQKPTVTILASTDGGASHTHSLATLSRDDLAELVPEGLDAQRWAHIDTTGTEADIAALDRDIRDLRRAGFADLATMHRFTLTMAATTGAAPADGTDSTSAPATVVKSFGALIEDTLKSDLARDLVKRGHIDRNFSLYAAQFYGHFSGTDVATFMVRHVQNNTMNVDYDLSRDTAAASVINDATEAGEDLPHSVAAYNIDLVNHLLATNHVSTGQVVNNLITGYAENDSNAVPFLAAYFTTDTALREELATQLAEHRWEHLFTYLTANTAVTEEARPALVSAALSAADPHATYDLGDDVRQFIVDNYAQMPVLAAGPHDAQTGDHDAARPGERAAERAVTVLDRADVVIPDLRALKDQVLRLVVDLDRYDLTADNIRKAVGITGEITLDAVSASSTKVYDFCLLNLGDYLRVVDTDTDTDHTVRNPDTLLNVLTDVTGRADVDAAGLFLSDLIDRSAPEARLRSLRAAPHSTWEALAAADRFRASLANVEDYRTHPDGPATIDAHLAAVLEAAGTVYTDEPGDDTDTDGNAYDRTTAATKILNATTIAEPATRVTLIEALAPPTPLPVDEINPERSDLFALLLRHDLVNDDLDTFTRICAGGWDAMGPAIAASNGIATFLEPRHVRGMVADVFNDARARDKIGDKIVNDLDAYVPADGHDATDNALVAAAEYAHAHGVALPADTVVRIAAASNNTTAQQRVVLRLLRDANPTANGQHILDTFGALGDPYDQISHKDKFDVGRTPRVSPRRCSTSSTATGSRFVSDPSRSSGRSRLSDRI